MNTFRTFLNLAAIVMMLLTRSGLAQNVMAWGNNSFGQTVVPPTATNVLAVASGSGFSLALRTDGSVLAWGNNACNSPMEARTRW